MKTIEKYMMTLINGLTEGTFKIKMLSAFQLSVISSPFFIIWEKITDWTISNHVYILIVISTIILDWGFGTWKHIKKKTFEFRANARGLITKTFLTFGAGILFEELHYIVHEADFLVVTLTIITRLIVFLYPASSAFKNIYVLSGEKFPPKAWMDKLNSFSENLNLKEFDTIKND
ncbi:MAG: hypothetical protein LBE36_06350 [Flavobacteriaceae bacterium]|jgi:hypothetical protein|nr:hypothetical protein [Flavobacteriaceae bacterium]